MKPIFVLLSFLLVEGVAAAAINCTNDTDCGGNTCGGMVCQWSASGHNCVPAGTDPQGSDGWCTTTANCKCMAQGATCAAPHCTFTLIQDMSGPARDLAGAPAADLSLSTSSDLSVAGAADLSASAPPPQDLAPSGSGPTTTKKSGCAIAGAGADLSSLALLAAALVGLRLRRRAD